ncbi:hypothetical protein K9M16_04800 [Candidatus Babeliales bacterium]|nr:hypothetical protein [Candidatus Babeliales bacterium]
MNNSIYYDFVKSFKVALINCSIYFPTHPIFSQSINALKEKINLILESSPFLSITIKPESLIINENILDDKNFYKELANQLHCKKIKSIKINNKITNQELSQFLLAISSSRKDILSEGGVGKILRNKELENIIIEELDYSQLIKGEGGRVKDVWRYFLNSKDNQEELKKNFNKFISDLEEIANEYGVKEILSDDKLSRQLLDLFSKLRKEDKEKFKKGLISLSRLILKDENLKDIKNKDEFKNLFSDIEAKQLAKLLFKMLKSKQFVSSSAFKLFSTLVPLKVHKEAAVKLGENIKTSEEEIDVDKINDLFLSIEDQGIVPIYQKSLLINAATNKKERKFYFDQDHLKQNYRLILLDLFFYELNFKQLELILEKIISEIENDYLQNINFICKFAKIYKEKPAEINLNKFNARVQKIWAKAEINIFTGDDYEKFNFLEELLENSTLEASYYLDKINENRFNPLVLKLFFKFFPNQSLYLSKLIKTKSKNPTFFKKIIVNFRQIDNPLVLNILKDLFGLVSIPAKIEILEVIKKYFKYDKDFFLSLARSQNFNLRKKVVEISVGFPDLYQEIVKNLFSGKNCFGINSKIILENLDIIKENCIAEALPFLQELRTRKYFWNRKIRNKANGILETYYERKD